MLWIIGCRFVFTNEKPMIKQLIGFRAVQNKPTIRKNWIVQKEDNRKNSFKELENDRQCLLKLKNRCKATLLYIEIKRGVSK